MPRSCVRISGNLSKADGLDIWNAYKGKTVLVTGHTGFKGSWLALWLTQLGARVIGVALAPPSEPSNFAVSHLGDVVSDIRCDIRDTGRLRDIVHAERPDFIFHLAAQAIVRTAYREPLETYSCNAIGTVSVLEALRAVQSPVVAVMITSDKAYDNVEWPWGYRENDRLGGKDPYSASKGMAELAIRSYMESFFRAPDCAVRLAIARAGNVIGGGDWAADRIVPDCVRAWATGRAVDIRSPFATRPWQHVLEPLGGYLTLGAALANSDRLHREAFNFGPPADQNHTVQELIEAIARHWKAAEWSRAENPGDTEAGLLKLNCDKALIQLSWRATLTFEETVSMTAGWYAQYYESRGSPMGDYSRSQIARYTELHDSRRMGRAPA